MSARHTLDDRRRRKPRRLRGTPVLRYPVVSPGAGAEATQRARGHGMSARQWAEENRAGRRRLVEDYNKRGRL